MPLLYSRKEKDNEIVIVFKYKVLVYILFVAAFVLAFVDVHPMWSFIPGAISLLLLIFGFWKPNREIKKAMSRKQVHVSGKNFSLKHPLTFRIPK